MRPVLLILLLLLSADAFGQAPAPPIDTRLLCVVDTSYSMRLVAPGTAASIKGLVGTAFEGFLQSGDLFNLWTFNEEVFPAPRFPAAWNATDSGPMADFLGDFIEHQKFQKQTRYEHLIPEIKRFTREKDSLVVLIFSDGQDKITGTPYDAVINDWTKSVFREARRSKIPIIILLTASHGVFTSWNVQLSSKPLWLPPEARLRPLPKPVPEKPIEIVKAPEAVIANRPRTDETSAAVTALSRDIPGVIVNPPRPIPPPPVAVTNAPPVEIWDAVAENIDPGVTARPVSSNSTTISAPLTSPVTNEIVAPAPPEEPVIVPHRNGVIVVTRIEPATKPWGLVIAVGAVLLLLVTINGFRGGREENNGSLITRALKK